MRSSSILLPPAFLYCASGEAGIHRLDPNPQSSHRVTEAYPAKSFFLAAHPSRPVLYSVNERTGTISAMAVAPDGTLSLITEVRTHGTIPCHVAVDPLAQFVAVAIYRGGVEIFPLRKDGGLEPSSDVHQPTGNGPNPRQEGSHPHSVTLVDGVAYVADLGSDRIFALKIEGAPPHFVPLPQKTQVLARGSGPRHFSVHPGGTHAVSVNELDNTVTAFTREPVSGRLIPAGNLSTLPPDFKDESWTAEVGYHPKLDLCYASNRGHDTLAIFSFEPRTGGLQGPQFFSSGGEKPQHFLFNSTGTLLFIANMGSNNVSCYRMNRSTGMPLKRLPDYPVKKPMCLAFAPALAE
jgi:6-phosphogluconolactonase